MQTGTIEATLGGLSEDFRHFKERQEEKIRMLEHKLTCKILPSIQRPHMEIKADNITHKHFDAFLRKGEQGLETKTLSRGEDPGSYLIPYPVQERITGSLEAGVSFRTIARTMMVSSSSVDIIVDTKAPTLGWVGEADARPETEAPGLSKINIPLHEIYAKPKSTQALLDDAAINVEDWLVQKVAEKMARLENEAFVRGDGEKKPKGFLSYDSVAQEDWVWGKLEHIRTGVDGGFKENMGSDTLIDTVERMPTTYLTGSVWVMSRAAHAVVRKFRDRTTGQHLWSPSLTEEAPATLLGYPVLVMDEMPTLVAGRASKSIAFGNFKESYQIVDRAQMHVLRDPYSAKPYVEFYVTKRVGGDVINFEAIKVINFSS